MLRRLAASRSVRIGVALVAVGLGVLAVAEQWGDVRRAAGQLQAGALALALIAVLVGLFASMLSWRALLADLGSPLTVRDAMRVFYLGQLGKYLPGAVWWLLGQIELAHDRDVPRRRTAATGVLTVLLSLAAGLGVAMLTLPLLSAAAAARYWPVLLLLPVLLGALHPRLLNPSLDRVLRFLRREPLERPLSGRGVAVSLSWAGLAWVAFGAQIAVLADGLGASGVRAVLVCVGAFALAWSVGFLAVVVPAGIGVREAALVAALAPVLRAGPALVVAVISRVLMSGGDLIWAGAAALPRGPRGAPGRPAGDVPLPAPPP